MSRWSGRSWWGSWRHAGGPPRPQITLADASYGRDGEICYPRHRARAGEGLFPLYLRQARALLAVLPGQVQDGPAGLSPEFEALRWFPLPRASLAAPRAPVPAWPA